ncbi:MAG: hypothetical protein IIC78_13590 [Chloroflexi bacterium]|nr:hypothetical protein [Chloroflexota bacterium]
MKSKTLVFLFMIFASACSQVPDEELPPSSKSGLDPDKQEALDQLTEELGQVPEIIIKHGISRFIAPQLSTDITDPEAAVRDLFNTYSALFGLENPDAELLLDSILDVGGGTMVRFAQQLNGIPIYAAETVSLLTNENELSFVSGALQPSTELSTEPGIDAQAAIIAAIENSGDAFAVLQREPQLMFFSPVVLGLSEADMVLAWELALLVDQGDRGPSLITQFLIDANRGELVFDALEEFNEENWNICDAQNSVTSDPTPKPSLGQAILIYENKDGELSTILDANNNPLSDA